jgi:hypothetical protein
MPRLPQLGGDDGNWGQILNDFLAVEHVVVSDPTDPNYANNGKLIKESLILGAQQTSEKGQPGGYAALDNTGKVPSANLPAGNGGTPPDATASSKGVIQLAGDLGGTAAAPTVPGLANKYDKQSGGIPKTDLASGVQTSLLNADNAVLKTVVAAQGDILVGTASGVVGKQTLGSPGQVLSADGSTPTGLRWITPTGGGHIIAEGATTFNQRSTLNFVGTGVTITDDAANDTTKVTVAITSEYLDVTDPRIGCVPNISADQGSQIQAGIDLAASSGNGTLFFPPGVYQNKSVELALPTTAQIRILGAGSGEGLSGISVIQYPNDLFVAGGPEKFAFKQITANYQWVLEKITILGPGGGAQTQMNGILCLNRGFMEDVRIQGFRAGIVAVNDHQEWHTLDLRKNGFGMDWHQGSGGFGDHLIDNIDMRESTIASLGISWNSTIAQGRFIQCKFGKSPYAIYRYADSAAELTTCILGCVFSNCTFESCGNGIAYDASNGAYGLTIGQTYFDPWLESGTWAASAYKWGSHPLRAAFDLTPNGGFIGVEFRGSPPKSLIGGSEGTLPAVRAKMIGGLRMRPGNKGANDLPAPGSDTINELADVVNHAKRIFVQSGGSSNLIGDIYIGENDVPGSVAASALVTSSPLDPAPSPVIEKFDLVELYQQASITKSNNAGPPTPSAVMGVALDTYDKGEVCVFWTRGQASYLKVKTKTGTNIGGGQLQIAEGSLLRPDPANPGHVKIATDWSDGQIIGQATQDITFNSGATGTGTANLFGLP